jgi:hypothetical protein
MGDMDFSGEPGDSARAALGVPGYVAARWSQFVPLAYVAGLGWVRITAPRPDARAACLSVTAHIHLLQPDLPLRELDAQAEIAIKALEGGEPTVTVIDELHRVDRTTGP